MTNCQVLTHLSIKSGTLNNDGHLIHIKLFICLIYFYTVPTQYFVKFKITFSSEVFFKLTHLNLKFILELFDLVYIITDEN